LRKKYLTETSYIVRVQFYAKNRVNNDIYLLVKVFGQFFQDLDGVQEFVRVCVVIGLLLLTLITGLGWKKTRTLS
jgi:hypothetical protein